MHPRTLKNLDWLLLICVVCIIALGACAVYSAAGGGKHGLAYVQKQLSTAVVGFALMALMASLDDNILPRVSRYLYWPNILMLLLVDVIGRHSGGAQRWLAIGPVEIQPSEPAKVVLIITLSVLLVANYDSIKEVPTVLRSLLHIALPLVLIFKQPDLGTTLVICVIWLGIALAAGVQWKHIGVVVLVAVVSLVIAWNTGLIRDYQKQRLTSFLDPDADPRGSGYHIRQSKIAIGSGEVTGRGYRQGTQSQLNFIPEQHTDFIFTVPGEEFGFVGSAGVVLLYWLMVSRVATAMQTTEERLGRMISGGVLAMLLFHVFVNIGMTLGIMPVTGVPLPLFSYGRSNMLTTLAALGLVMGTNRRRDRISF